MIVKLLTEHHLEVLSLKGGCRGSFKFTLVKMSNCWKSHAAAHMILSNKRITKALIRLRGCAGWSAPVLVANHKRQVFLCLGPYKRCCIYLVIRL